MAAKMNAEHFSTVRVLGGPAGVMTTTTIDGVEQKGLTHISLDADVKGAVEVVCERIAVLDIEVVAKVRDLWDVRAVLRVIPGPSRPYSGSGASLSEAIRDIAALVGHDERNGDIRGQ